MADFEPSAKRRRVDRVLVACDLCKTRKVKCDGNTPCSYCKKRNHLDTCTFSTTRTAQTDPLIGRDSISERSTDYRDAAPGNDEAEVHPVQRSTNVEKQRSEYSGGTMVPLEARLLRDTEGKTIFIGDCAPLSFLQTVRHLIASKVDPHGLPVPASRDSVIEIPPERTIGQLPRSTPTIATDAIEGLVAEYFAATRGLVDLFENQRLVEDTEAWLHNASYLKDVNSATYWMILAIALQESQNGQAEACFDHAKNILLAELCGSMNTATVQGFMLVTIYMLRAAQPNGAYLYFSLAARTAYAIGIHRTEVNASFGTTTHALRDRIWKSLRVVDILISILLARPPVTSDVDCTVKYTIKDVDSDTSHHILDASVEVIMIIERVVVEVYSSKRISLRIANFVSRQLKLWATKWIRPFTDVVTQATAQQHDRAVLAGACQVLCLYFYGILLLTRPFLVYDLYEYLGNPVKPQDTNIENEEKRNFADAAVEAATALTKTVRLVIDTDKLSRRMPLIVPWLFTASVVLAVSVLGRCGRTVEEPCRTAMACLDHFVPADPQARQYSIITQALLRTTLKYVEERNTRFRSRRKQASAQLFGLLDNEVPSLESYDSGHASSTAPVPHPEQNLGEGSVSEAAPSINEWSLYDADFFAVPWFSQNIDEALQDFLQPGRQGSAGALVNIPLFPMEDETGSHPSTQTRIGP